MTSLQAAALYATIAGATIPLGGLTACIERMQPGWMEEEFRHTVMAFGGGALFSAIALVLVPEGIRYLSVPWVMVAFGAGGVFFFLVDRLIEKRGGAASMLLAMLLDFLPESMAMGAMLATEKAAGLLLAVLIALQNYPEGFNAYRELRADGEISARRALLAFCGLVLLGPLAAWFGFTFLQDAPATLGAVMMFAAGGILYLIFEDIAPQVRLEHHWAPPLGAVGGFMLGLLGYAILE